MLEKLIEIHSSLLHEVEKYPFKRHLYEKIDWRQRLIGIVGARGVGKTTLMLQYGQEEFDTPEDCLYISADHIIVIERGLYNIAEEFFKLGGKTLLVDEVHKHPRWQQALKNIHDSFPTRRVVFSGSSSIHILKGQADLSRRAVFYDLKGLSFREFLQIHLDKPLKPFSLNELLKSHIKIASELSSQIPVLKYLRDYFRFGYYPFFKEGIDVFHTKLNQVVEKIFYDDIPVLFNVKPPTIHGLKKLFYLVATSQPFVPNITRISHQLGISKEYIYTYLDELQKAGLFILLWPHAQGLKLLRKPQKVYLENVNLFSLVEESRGLSIQKGSLRETFFLNQVSSATKLFFSHKADFEDRRGRLFEVGGKSKPGKPSESSMDHFTVSDDLQVGFKNKIPLWLFGFLY